MKAVESVAGFTIFQDVSSATDWYFNITNINFIPDMIIVRNISLQGTASGEVYNIWSDLVNGDGIIGSLTIDSQIQPHSKFQSNGSVNGNHHFKLYTSDKSTASAVTNLDNLVINLEFVKYAK